MEEIQQEDNKPSETSPDGHHTWTVTVMLKKEDAQSVGILQQLFAGIGASFAGDSRCPFVIGVTLSDFRPETGIILPAEMADMTHVFLFSVKLKSELKKEQMILEEEKNSKLIV